MGIRPAQSGPAYSRGAAGRCLFGAVPKGKITGNTLVSQGILARHSGKISAGWAFAIFQTRPRPCLINGKMFSDERFFADQGDLTLAYFVYGKENQRGAAEKYPSLGRLAIFQTWPNLWKEGEHDTDCDSGLWHRGHGRRQSDYGERPAD
ncbi:hypothetical protein AALA80_03720 [Oscillospiraceae bacterium 50-60]